jgi:hypothetical protein
VLALSEPNAAPDQTCPDLRMRTPPACGSRPYGDVSVEIGLVCALGDRNVLVHDAVAQAIRVRRRGSRRRRQPG